MPELVIVAVADPSIAAADALRQELGYNCGLDPQEIIRDQSITAVLICSPTLDHIGHVLNATRAGKHVFCEKPLALTEEDAQRCVVAAEQAGVVLQIGFNRRFDPNFEALKDGVRAGAVGTPLIVRITSRDPEPPPGNYPRQAGGFYVDSVIHDFDMARYLLGEEVIEVSTFGSALYDQLSSDAGDTDTAVTILRFKSGAVAALDNARVSSIGYDQRIEVHGTRGTMLAENIRDQTTVLWDLEGEHRPPIQHFFAERYAEAYARQLRGFAAAIRGGPVRASGRDGVMAQRLAACAYRSLLEHRAVMVLDGDSPDQEAS